MERAASTSAPGSGHRAQPRSFAPARRLGDVPAFLFNQIDDKKRAAIAAGRDVINLGTGDPDRPTPGFIVEAMARAVAKPDNHRYPDGYGTREFLLSAARFMERRFGVRVDPGRHLVACIGSKDGISHLPLAVTNPGDGVIYFPPAYPVYAAGAALAGARPIALPAGPEHGWLPDLTALGRASGADVDAAKLLWLNYPNNPTGARADSGFFDSAARWCAARGVVLASDLAYSEVYFDSSPVASLWQAPGASIETFHGIEFHSLSKTFNMTGWRIGFAVGHEGVISALKRVKDNYDSGPFNAVQEAAAVALDRFDDPEITAMRREYALRRDSVVSGLRRAGCEVFVPEAGIFVWARCPVDAATGEPMESWAFVERAIEEASVVMVPGAGFGESCRRWVRVSLTRETSRIAEAMDRLARVAW